MTHREIFLACFIAMVALLLIALYKDAVTPKK